MSAQTDGVLSSEGVDAIFLDCLKGNNVGDTIEVEGIVGQSVFSCNRLAENKTVIEAMLDELPDVFKKSRGGGYSFLGACNDRHGKQWTSFHLCMDRLFQLGIGIGKVEYLLPRKMWSIFPGGMPYYVIN